MLFRSYLNPEGYVCLCDLAPVVVFNQVLCAETSGARQAKPLLDLPSLIKERTPNSRGHKQIIAVSPGVMYPRAGII